MRVEIMLVQGRVEEFKLGNFLDMTVIATHVITKVHNLEYNMNGLLIKLPNKTFHECIFSDCLTKKADLGRTLRMNLVTKICLISNIVSMIFIEKSTYLLNSIYLRS